MAKTKVTHEQFDLMKALSTGVKAKAQVDTVMGMPVYELEEYDVEAELLKTYEIVEDSK